MAGGRGNVAGEVCGQAQQTQVAQHNFWGGGTALWGFPGFGSVVGRLTRHVLRLTAKSPGLVAVTGKS